MQVLKKGSGASWSMMRVKTNGGVDMDTNVSTMIMIFLLLRLEKETVLNSLTFCPIFKVVA